MTSIPTTSQETLRALKRGEAVIFPTDTLYGLGISVNHAISPDVLYRLKRREKRKPIAWLVAHREDLDVYGRVIPSYAYTLARTFWPGPLTIIVKASNAVPEAFRSEAGTIGMRMPANDTAQRLIASLGCPIATTSANISGKKNALSFKELDPEMLEQVSAVMCDKEVQSGIASTIVDCSSGDHPVLLREGAITIADIQALS